LVCSAQWITTLRFSVDASSAITGNASTTIDGSPLCTHPEYFQTPVTMMTSTIAGTASATQLQLQLIQVAYDPAGSIDATGMATSLYGIDATQSPTITVPVTSLGHAAGSQQLQTVSGSNAYTSDNTLTLACQAC
jgi:hypothetical protein